MGCHPPDRQARLEVYTNTLRCLADKGLTAADVAANFHRRRVLSLMERELPLFQMMEGAPSEGTQMMVEQLSREIATQRAGRVVGASPDSLGNFWGIAMRPDEGYIQIVSFVSWLWLFCIIVLS